MCSGRIKLLLVVKKKTTTNFDKILGVAHGGTLYEVLGLVPSSLCEPVRPDY